MISGVRRMCATSAQAVHRFGALLLLAACADGTGAPTDVVIPLRNPTVQIGAIARFDLASFAGDWVVLSFVGKGWVPRSFNVVGRQWTEVRPEGGRDVRLSGTLTEAGTGRLTLTMQDGTQRDMWIVWIDEGHNTAAIGTPDGSFGLIAQRRGVRRADQLQAAARVMEFNGYRPGDWLGAIGPD